MRRPKVTEQTVTHKTDVRKVETQKSFDVLAQI